MGLRNAGAMHVSMRAPLSAAALGMTAAVTTFTASAIPRTFVASAGADTHPCPGCALSTPASNYVRDNVTDDGGHTPDSLL
jgi:stage V sporulation protein SpoVS